MSSPNPNWTNEQLYNWLDNDPDFSFYSDAFKDNDVSVKEFYGMNLAKLMSYPYTLPFDIANRLEKIIQAKPTPSAPAAARAPSPQPHILPPPTRTKGNLGVSSSSPSLGPPRTRSPSPSGGIQPSNTSHHNTTIQTRAAAPQRPPQRSLKESGTFTKLSFLCEGKGLDGSDVEELSEHDDATTKESKPSETPHQNTDESKRQCQQKSSSFATPGIHIDANTSIEEAQKLLGMMEAKSVGATLMIGMDSGKDKKRRSKDAAPILKPVKYVTEPCSVVFSNIATQQLDYWTSIPMEIKRWPAETEKCEPLLISPSVLRNGFSLETWSRDDPKEPLANDAYETEIKGVKNYYNVIMRILEPDIEYEFYKTFMYRFPHENYITRLGDNPVVISVETSDLPRTKIIFRKKEGSQRIFANKKVDQLNISEFIPEIEGVKLFKVKEEGIKTDLVRYDELFKVNHYKFGLLYVGPNQNNEDEIYSNRTGTSAYEEFLNFIGNVIQLKGHAGYRGGLNVTDNETGTHSVYTTYRDFEIMFHVCTMLPFQEHDAQRVERKRHIGNDVVVLVFKEQANETDYFDPQILTSHFNSCFIVVSPIKDRSGATTSYRLNVANKSGITPYYPYFPAETSVFNKDEAFKEFLLLKLINSERIAMHSGEFVVNALNARKMQLNEILKKYEKKKH